MALPLADAGRWDGLVARLAPDRLGAGHRDEAAQGGARLVTFRPESFVLFPAWLWAAGAGVATVASVLGALAPAAAASRVDPARAIA